jgi:hypothetical protein
MFFNPIENLKKYLRYDSKYENLQKPVEHHSQMRQNLIVVVNMLFVDSIWHPDIDD